MRFSGRGPRPFQDRGPRAAPPLQPRPLNASVRRQIRPYMRYLWFFLLFLTALFTTSCVGVKTSSNNLSGLPGPSHIQGHILDVDGAPICGASIQLSSSSLSGKREASTDENGFYSFFQLPAGRDYLMTVDIMGYPRIERRNIYLRPFTTLTINHFPSMDYINLDFPTPMLDY